MTRTLTLLLALAACGSPEPTPAPSQATIAPLAARAVSDTAVDDEHAPHDDEVSVALHEAEGPPVDAEEADEAPTAAPEGPSTTWEVRRGETLAHYARWSELPVETIAEASELSLAEALAVGATVRVPGDETVRARVEEARDAHHRRRAHGYLASRGGAQGTDFYTVRTGDTAWTVANDEIGVPVWLLETYNPSVDLDRLRPGQRLMVPVIADTVADATPGSSEAP
jgi:hypothetical protein